MKWVIGLIAILAGVYAVLASGSTRLGGFDTSCMIAVVFGLLAIIIVIRDNRRKEERRHQDTIDAMRGR